MSIISHVKITSNFIAKNHHVRSDNFTSYCMSICLLFKFNMVPILVLSFQFLQNCQEFCLYQCHFKLIINVIKCCIFTPFFPIKYKFMGPYTIQPVSIAFHENWPIFFSYKCFPISSVTPQRLFLNEFNLTWYYIFVIRSLINCSALESIIRW